MNDKLADAACLNSVSGKIESALAWLKRRETLVLLVGVGIQLVVLLGMIGTKLVPIVSGKVVLLRTQPVDPRDMFRGDYVTLSYEFSRVPPTGIANPSGVTVSRTNLDSLAGQTVYVTLVPDSDGRHWKAASYSTQRPSDGVFLCGTVGPHGNIAYGIESYYVQEGKGRKFEDAVRSRHLSVEASVSSDGQAVLRRLVIE